MPRWTKKDKQRVRDVIDAIAARFPTGQTGIADALGLKDRRVVNNWRMRGVVPLEHYVKLIGLAPIELGVLPSDLNPTARMLADMAKRAAS